MAGLVLQRGVLEGRWTARRSRKIRSWRRASTDDNANDRFDEETVSKLRKAEEEATRLRQELAALRANQEKETVLAKAGRTFWTTPIDSKDLKRETILESNAESGNWLSEADVDFLTGRENGNGMSAEDQAIVNRRLVVGGVVSALFVGFAFIPSEKFNFFKPSGRAADYLVPVLRSQESRPLVEEAEWEQVRVVIDRIINTPNKLKSNLDAALSFVSGDEKRERGRQLIRDIMEFIQETDYNRYYEDRLNQRRFKGGAEEAKFVEFSLQSLKTAEIRLEKFLALFSQDELENAKSQIAAVKHALKPSSQRPARGLRDMTTVPLTVTDSSHTSATRVSVTTTSLRLRPAMAFTKHGNCAGLSAAHAHPCRAFSGDDHLYVDSQGCPVDLDFLMEEVALLVPNPWQKGVHDMDEFLSQDDSLRSRKGFTPGEDEGFEIIALQGLLGANADPGRHRDALCRYCATDPEDDEEEAANGGCAETEHRKALEALKNARESSRMARLEAEHAETLTQGMIDRLDRSLTAEEFAFQIGRFCEEGLPERTRDETTQLYNSLKEEYEADFRCVWDLQDRLEPERFITKQEALQGRATVAGQTPAHGAPHECSSDVDKVQPSSHVEAKRPREASALESGDETDAQSGQDIAEARHKAKRRTLFHLSDESSRRTVECPRFSRGERKRQRLLQLKDGGASSLQTSLVDSGTSCSASSDSQSSRRTRDAPWTDEEEQPSPKKARGPARGPRRRQ